jgi:hypothetical protein
MKIEKPDNQTARRLNSECKMTTKLPWYDSQWLELYLTAKELVGNVAPSKLPEFIECFEILRTDPDFSVIEVENVFDLEMLAEIRSTISSIPPNDIELHEAKRFGRFVVHNAPKFNELQSELVDLVSEKVGEAVEPSYNFLSLYTKRGVCEPHLDDPSAKWTLDVCINQSEPWPIYFSQVVSWPEDKGHYGDDWQESIKGDARLHFSKKELTPGNGAIFSGSSQWHYRDAMPGNKDSHFCDLLFFHYIPKGSSTILDPQNWARLFDIPELAQISATSRVLRQK